MQSPVTPVTPQTPFTTRTANEFNQWLSNRFIYEPLRQRNQTIDPISEITMSLNDNNKTLSSIGADVIYLVCQYLSFLDISYSVSRVCRMWYQSCYLSVTNLKLDIGIGLTEHNWNQMFYNIICLRCTNLNSLTVAANNQPEIFRNAHLRAFCKSHDDGILISLSLPNCSYLTSGNGFSKIPKYMKNLQHINLSNCVYLEDDNLEQLSMLSYLTHINFHCCEKITNDGFKRFLQVKQHLIYIDISCCAGLTDEIIEHLVDATHGTLQYLNILSLNRYSDKSCVHLARLHHLVTLKIGDSKSNHYMRNLFRMENLNVIYDLFQRQNHNFVIDSDQPSDFELTDCSMARVCESLPNLRHLSIKYCLWLGSATIEAITKNMVFLESLNIRGSFWGLQRNNSFEKTLRDVKENKFFLQKLKFEK
jgi:hypothetical protein